MTAWTKEGLSNGPVGHPWSFWTGGLHSGTFRNLLEHSDTLPENPELFRNPEIHFAIYKTLPPDHSRAPRDIQDLIRDSEQYSDSNSYSRIYPKRQRTLSVSPYGSRIMQT